MTTQGDTIRVWDIFVRTCHWALVVLCTVAYLTGEEESALHAYSGYAILVLVGARIVWGFVGPRRARFAGFLASPLAALQYLRGLATGTAPRYVGHNPAGGWMAVLLLATILATGASGVVVLGLEGEGPLAGRIAPDGWIVAVAGAAGGAGDEHESGDDAGEGHGAAEDDEHGDEEEDEYGAGREAAAGGEGAGLEAAEEAWEEWHEALANLSVFLVIVHVLGVIASSVAHRENLPRAMLTASSKPLVCRDWVPPSTAAMASMVVRTMLFIGSCSVRLAPEVWQWVRSIEERGSSGPKGSISSAQRRRAARSFATSA